LFKEIVIFVDKEELLDFEIFIGTSISDFNNDTRCAYHGTQLTSGAGAQYNCTNPVGGRYVIITKKNNLLSVSLSEVEAYGIGK
jgi:hypothetical protein